MRRRHRHPYRALAIVAAAIIFVGGGGVLVRRSLPLVIEGTGKLQAAAQLLPGDPAGASAEFKAASGSMRQSINAIRDSGPLALLSVLPPFRWQVRLAKASAYLANAGDAASATLAEYPKTTFSGGDVSAIVAGQSGAYFSWYAANAESLAGIQRDIESAKTELDAVPAWIFIGHGDEYRRLKDTVDMAAAALPKARSLSTMLASAFGSDDPSASPHRFLVLFQNDAELRPSGGFIGSYGTLTASSGTLRSFTFGTDIYKIDKPYMESAKVEPPDQLKTITQYWAFRDSTVGSGFRADAAEKAADFYTKETGTAIDGVIMLDTSILEDMLRLTGPVTLPGTSTEVTADTITLALTEQVEKTYYDSAENRAAMEPKSIINDLIPVLIGKLASTPGIAGEVPHLLSQAIARKSLQFWSSRPELQAELATVQPADAPTIANWIKIVNTNIGGLKSSPKVTQTVEITRGVSVLKRAYIYTVNIRRTHTGSGEWPDGDNKNFLEVYLPPNAKVTSLPQGNGGQSALPDHQQAEIGTLGKITPPSTEATGAWKRVKLWATTNVGQTTSYRLEYSLPLGTDTTLTYLNQAGARSDYLKAFGFDGPVKENLTLRD